MRILVLGTGLQGRATLHDLARSPAVSHVIAADADLAGLTRYLEGLKASKIEPVALDANNRDQVAALMRKVRAVIVLLPTAFHVPITRLAVESGIHLVNSSDVPPEFHEIGREAAARGLAILPEFGEPKTLDEYIMLTQEAQATLMRYALEVYRRRMFGTSGALMWQYDEPWPAVTFSLVDFFGRAKAAYYWARHGCAPVAGMFCAGEVGPVGPRNFLHGQTDDIVGHHG